MANEKLSRDMIQAAVDGGWGFEYMPEPDQIAATKATQTIALEPIQAWAARVDAQSKAAEPAAEQRPDTLPPDDPLLDSVYPSEPPSAGHSWRPGAFYDAKGNAPRPVRAGYVWAFSDAIQAWECRVGIFRLQIRRRNGGENCNVFVGTTPVFYEMTGDDSASLRAFDHFLSSQKMQLE